MIFFTYRCVYFNTLYIPDRGLANPTWICAWNNVLTTSLPEMLPVLWESQVMDISTVRVAASRACRSLWVLLCQVVVDSLGNGVVATVVRITTLNNSSSLGCRCFHNSLAGIRLYMLLFFIVGNFETYTVQNVTTLMGWRKKTLAFPIPPLPHTRARWLNYGFRSVKHF